MISVRLTLFGALRKFDLEGGLEVQCEVGETLHQFRVRLSTILSEKFPESESVNVVYDSVFANDEEILREDYILQKDISLAVLPPVCGG